MRSLFLAVLAVLLFAIPVMASNSLEDVTAPDAGFITPVPAPVWHPTRTVLFDNGGMVNYPGQGFGGADLSALEASIGMTVYGFGCQQSLGYMMADDFTIPANETWNIDSFTFFNYQTGSTLVSSITGIYFQIYNGDPQMGGTVIYGDMTTNRMDSSAFTNIYRAHETAPLTNNRPIMASVCSEPVVLMGGQYWVAFGATGSLASGPWAPPVTILNTPVTGDCLQYTTAWAYAISGTFGQGLPFIITGELGGTPTEHSTWGMIKSLFR